MSHPSHDSTLTLKTVNRAYYELEERIVRYLPSALYGFNYPAWFTFYQSYIKHSLRQIGVSQSGREDDDNHPRMFARQDLATLACEAADFVSRIVYHRVLNHFQATTLPLLPGNFILPTGFVTYDYDPENAHFEKLAVLLSLIRLEQSVFVPQADLAFTSETFTSHFVRRAGDDRTVRRIREAILPHWDHTDAQTQAGILADLVVLARFLTSKTFRMRRSDLLESIVSPNKTKPKLNQIRRILSIPENPQTAYSPSRITRRKKLMYFGRA
ncbi:hypothetical protein JCM16303_001457 [Sporobolomyces ruberrimus]